jgi:hypothetical protein
LHFQETKNGEINICQNTACKKYGISYVKIKTFCGQTPSCNPASAKPVLQASLTGKFDAEHLFFDAFISCLF